MIQLTVNQKPVQVQRGTSVLQAVRACDVELPTLCYHEGLAPYGSCRLCMVSISAPRRGLVASCVCPVEDGMVVETETAQAQSARRMVLEFLLGRCPRSEIIQNLAAKAGVKMSRFSKKQPDDFEEKCVLCGLCVRVCREVIGAAAIGFTGRGETRKVATPFEVQSEDCVGCGACAAICPTGAVRMEDQDGVRILHTWNTRIELHGCRQCGIFFVPAKLEVVKTMFPKIESIWDLCPRCRRRLALRQAKKLKPYPSDRKVL